MQSELKPDKGVIAEHLRHLFHWTSPENKFEVRCIHPAQRTIRSKLYGCAEFAQAAEFAAQANADGFNAYVTVNPLSPGVTDAAKDADVVGARWQIIDVDGVADPGEIAKKSDIAPTMVVITGTVPTARFHAYWLLDRDTDPVSWSQTQKGLATAFESDPSITNPSRIMRLAGTITYPDERKTRRGYVPEIAILSDLGAPVDGDNFQAAYRASQKPVPAVLPEKAEPTYSDFSAGPVPLDVVAQALDVIPPISGPGRRQEWLALAMSVKAANFGARHLFDQWQRQSLQYDRSDAHVWETIGPAAGSYAPLFAAANQHDPNWWRAGTPEVEMWWRRNAAELSEANQPHKAEDKKAAPTPSPDPIDISEIDLTKLPPRRWMYHDLLVRGFVTSLIGPGGTGKTSLALAVAMSIALNRDLFSNEDEQSRVRKQGAVLYWNLEDPLDEMKLRIAAELRHREITQRALRDNLFILSGRDRPLCVAERSAKGQAEATDITPVVQMLKERHVALLVVDPLINAHGLDGNDNSDLALVLDQFRKIAHEADCAVLIVHHFRKGGHGGDVESSLGAVTLTNSCRIVESLTPMSEEDARALGIELRLRRRYVRRDNAKMNLSAAPTQCEWFEFNSVALGNGTEEYPDGDNIGVLSRWKPLSPLHGLAWEQVGRVLKMIDQGLDDGREFYTPAVQGERWVGKLLIEHLGMNKEQAKATLKEWSQNRVLTVDTYNSPSNGYKSTKKICINPDGVAGLKVLMANRA